MFRIIKWVFWTTFWVCTVSMFHYTLPQKDIVRVTGTEIIRKDFSGISRFFYAQADSGDNDVGNRDLRLINTTRANGDVSVYRNEDTGFGWPPYFKLDSSNLQAEASDAISNRENPNWVMVKHYGWRSPVLSIYPNAISLRPVDGPDAPKGIPYLNILIIVVFAAIAWAIWVRWRRFRMARIDPTLEAIEDDMVEKTGAIRRWLGSWKKKA